MVKNYGGIGYLDPTNRNWENPVFQAGKAALDKEFNLVEDLSSGYGQAALKRAIPSGWIADAFLDSSPSTSDIFSFTLTANTLVIANNLIAHVNGWLLQVADTNTSVNNTLVLSPGPVGDGTKRTDLVVLEVWRMLVSPSPSIVGKSPAGRIWRYGNVKIDAGDDVALNYVDDILDGTLGVESTKRVQIQYRLRVIDDVDLFTYPYGLDDPTVVANTIPVDALIADGTASAFTFLNRSGDGDAGLWRAGDGDPTNGLGTVDGYMYAIPLMAIFRRNTSAFDKNSNHNGGAVIFGGGSTRPDGLYTDIVYSDDVADLRIGVSTTGWNYAEILEKNFNYLLDNALRSDWMTTLNGGGVKGHTVIAADEIGISGGDSVTTGDTPGATFIGEFDAARRTFSDRSIYEVVTLKFPSPGVYSPGSTFTIDPTNLTIGPYPAANWASYNDPRVMFIDVLRARFIGDAGVIGSSTYDFSDSLIVTGLGAQPITPVTVTIAANYAGPPSIAGEPTYIDLLVAYPSGLGLSSTPTLDYSTTAGAAFCYIVNNPGQLPAALPVGFDTLASANAIDTTHREIRLQYVGLPITNTDRALEANGVTYFLLPERASSVSNVLINGVATNPVSLDATGRIVTYSGGDVTNISDSVQYDYTPLRPLPRNGEQMTIYYETRAPQTSRSDLLGTSITITPRHIGKQLTVLTVGSGSQDTSYPFPTAYVQTGGIYPGSLGTFAGEHELSAGGDIAVSNFEAATGMLRLPTFIDFVPNPESFVLNRDLSDIDAEGRSFFKTAPAGYQPNAYAQDLTDIKRHKVVLPMIAELTADSPLGFAGQLVLVLLTRWAKLDTTDGVFFDTDLIVSTTSASIFRLRGNLINKKA